MTINEAATLVIQAGAIDIKPGQTPSIFVLDMGAPLRIADLAQRFVRLHGFDPRLAGVPVEAASGTAIDVVFTGARPGEKIHEELAYAAEALTSTPYAGIMALAGSVHAEFDVASMVADFSALRSSSDRGAILAAIRRHVPEMAPEAAPLQRETAGSRTKAA